MHNTHFHNAILNVNFLCIGNKLYGRPPQYVPAPCKLTDDLLILKVVSESRVTCATSVPILVFLGLSVVLDLGPMYTTDRQTSDAHHHLNATYPRGGGIISIIRKIDLQPSTYISTIQP